jgi:ABC-2 type transport system permease protein
MSTEAADLRSAPVSRSVPHDTRTTLTALVRREFWEHAALWWVPLGMGAFLLLAAMVSSVMGHQGAPMPRMEEGMGVMILNGSQFAFAAIVYFISASVVTYYALDCLYAERKDRSILFWKSLPVSDGLTVLSKFLVAMVVVPLLAFAAALVCHLLGLVIWELRVAAGGVPDVIRWDTLAWLRGELVILMILVLSSLWYAPVIAACMLLSAWLRRGPPPWVWALVGPFVLALFELIIFRTHYLWGVLRYRRMGIWTVLTHKDGHPVLTEHMHVLGDFNWVGAFTDLDLWLGVLVAGALLYAAARVRRYRDDT